METNKNIDIIPKGKDKKIPTQNNNNNFDKVFRHIVQKCM